jgi:hypothetical protein
MIYLHVIVEGDTEKNFVKRVLDPYLGYDYCIDASLITTSRDRRRGRVFKGGLGNYKKTKLEILNRLKQYKDRDHRFTTMFDLYALPDDFPGSFETQNIVNPHDKVKKLENFLAEDLDDHHRFIPYIQLHEFEAMVFVDPGQLIDEYPDAANRIDELKAVKIDPELINHDKPPSYRILDSIPDYHKPVAGVNTVEKIGIDAIRKKCPHFNEWLCRLEQLKPNLQQQ